MLYFETVIIPYDTVNLRTMPRRTPKVTIPRMIQITTKCPEQQPIPFSFPSLLGRGEIFFCSLMGSLLGAPFSAITILWVGGLLSWECPKLAMLAWSDLLSPGSRVSAGVGGWLWLKWWPGGAPGWDSSATDLALRTVVAPDITEGGTEYAMDMDGA